MPPRRIWQARSRNLAKAAKDFGIDLPIQSGTKAQQPGEPAPPGAHPRQPAKKPRFQLPKELFGK
jgi:hypothetical protein